MKKTLKGLLAAAGVATILASAPAHAADVPCVPGSTLDTCYFGLIAGNDTFANWKVGTLTLGAGASNVTGYFDAIGASFGSVSLVGAGATLSDGAEGGFSFANVASGTYDVLVTGNFRIFPQFFNTNLALYGAGFDVTAVPEPETYALLLAGLMAIGYVARRRKAD
jgi:hypothetical protein